MSYNPINVTALTSLSFIHLISMMLIEDIAHMKTDLKKAKTDKISLLHGIMFNDDKFRENRIQFCSR